MAALPNSAFQRALQKFRQGLTDEQKQQFAGSSLGNVHAEIQRIQDQYGSTKKLRSLNRVSKFLEAMTQIEQLVQVFLNVSEVVAFVWGPIKLALLVASARVETLECLLNTYVEVGEVIPGLRQYDQLFKAAPAVLDVLERYFCDILEFHRNALDVFTKPAWRTFFDSSWKTFKTRMNPIIESLKRHRTLLLDERMNAAVFEVQTSRDQTLQLLNKSSDQSTDQFDKLERHVEDVYTRLSSQIYELHQSTKEGETDRDREISLQEMNFIINKLDPPGFEADQYTALNSCHHGSGTWILKDSTFSKWIRSKSLPDSVLFINGMPGAGKTLLASRIISHLRPQAGSNNTSCLFFYFKHSDTTKRSMSNMLRALLVQLIYQDNTLIRAFHKMCCSKSNADARQLHTLKSWAVELFKSQSTCTIILDGIDECSHQDGGDKAKSILEWFSSCVIPECLKEGSVIRLVALGQRDGVVDKVLSGFPMIRLDATASHLDDIRLFTKSRALEIRRRFSLDAGEENKIIQKVTVAAKGMFLYAKVVVDNLMAQGSAAELDEELEAKFPDGLDEAYARVVFRVLDRPTRPRSQREAATKILRWLTCAVRPLRWSEIQSLFCIDPHRGHCSPRNRRVDSCKGLCGSFVEVDRPDPSISNALNINPVVSLVHDTARRYLIKTCHVDLFEDNASMVIFSSAYLASSPFNEDRDNKDILEIALSGYYGLQDYAVSSWQNHISLALEQRGELSSKTIHSLRRVLFELSERLNLSLGLGSANEDLEKVEVSLDSNGFEDCTQRLEQLSSAIRATTENIRPNVLDVRTREVFLSLNGQSRYKCPKSRCLMFSHGFENRKARDLHAAQHHNQFSCAVDGCPRQTVGFTLRVDLDNHTKQAHINLAKSLDLFPPSRRPIDIFSACGKGDIEALVDFYEQGASLHLPCGDRGGLTPIVLAARNGHLELCQYLVSNGCKIFDTRYNKKVVNTALGEAIKSCNGDLFGLLMSSASEQELHEFINSDTLVYHIAAAVNAGGREILDTMLSLRSRRQSQMKYSEVFYHAVGGKTPNKTGTANLYEYFFNLIPPDEASGILAMPILKNGGNYLHRACRSGNELAVAFLLRLMEPQHQHAQDKDGKTAFCAAVEHNATECVKPILDNGLANDMSACDRNGHGPLHIACDFRELEVIKLLLPYFLRHLSKENKDGNTPLHLILRRTCVASWPAKGSAKQMTQALLETGAVDLSKRNKYGKTVFDMTSDREILSLLHSANAQAEVMGKLASENSLVIPTNEEESAELKIREDQASSAEREDRAGYSSPS